MAIEVKRVNHAGKEGIQLSENGILRVTFYPSVHSDNVDPYYMLAKVMEWSYTQGKEAAREEMRAALGIKD